MTKRLTYSAPVSLPIVSSLLKQKTAALASGILIPDSAIADLELYYKRNTIVEKVDHGCCPDCLKAHYYAVLSGHIGRKSAQEIVKTLPGNFGHDGYYLDKEELKKLED